MNQFKYSLYTFFYTPDLVKLALTRWKRIRNICVLSEYSVTWSSSQRTRFSISARRSGRTGSGVYACVRMYMCVCVRAFVRVCVFVRVYFNVHSRRSTVPPAFTPPRVVRYRSRARCGLSSAPAKLLFSLTHFGVAREMHGSSSIPLRGHVGQAHARHGRLHTLQVAVLPFSSARYSGNALNFSVLTSAPGDFCCFFFRFRVYSASHPPTPLVARSF